MAAYTEVEWNLKFQAPAAVNDTYEFRVYDGSTPLASYVTAQLTVAIDLVVANGTHAHSADNVTVTEVVPAVNLVVADATHTVVSDALALYPVPLLVVETGTHALASDNVTLVVEPAVQSATHAHTADNVALVVDLVVQSAAHALVSDTPTLYPVPLLDVAAGDHTHTADNVTVTEVGSVATDLVVQDATHAVTSTNITSFAWNPSFIPGLTGWWDAQDAASVVGSPVTSWNDISGGGHHLTPSGAGTYEVTTVLGLPMVTVIPTASGADMRMSHTGWTRPTTETIFGVYWWNPSVLTMTGGAGLRCHSADTVGDRSVYWYGVDEWYSGYSTYFWHPSGRVLDSERHVHASQHDGASSWYDIDGRRATGTNSTVPPVGFYWGGDVVTNAGGQPTWAAGEIITVNGTLTQPEVDQVYDYLRIKWNLATTLDVQDGLHDHVVRPEVKTLAPVFTDNFNRADGALGANWSGSGTITGNRLSPTVAMIGAVAVPTTGPDHYVEAKFYNATAQSMGLVVRSSADGRNRVNAKYEVTNWRVFYTVDIGGLLDIDIAQLPDGPAPADGDTVRFEAQGIALRLYVNDALILSTPFTSFRTNTSGGVGPYGYSGGQFDDFVLGSLDITLSEDVNLVVQNGQHSHRALPVDIAPPYFTDDFNRADGAPGANWELTPGEYAISGNRLTVGVGGLTDAIYWLAPVPGPNHYVQAKLYGVSPSYSHYLLARSSGSRFLPTEYRGLWWGNAWRINEITAGGYGLLATVPPLPFPVDGDTVRFEVEGELLRLYHNGNLIVAFSDPTITSGTRVGLHTYGPTGFEDFEVGPIPEVVLTEVPTLVVANGQHAHTCPNVVLIENSTLAVQDAYHGHSADNPTLQMEGDLAVQDAIHAHTATNVDITQVHILAVDSAVHAHTAEATVLYPVPDLLVASAVHAHTAASISLGVDLYIQSATNSHSAGNVDLVVDLAVASATHAHIAGSPVLYPVPDLIVAASVHAHTAVSPVLVAVPAVQSAAHSITSPDVIITPGLLVSNGLHLHEAQEVSLSGVPMLSVQPGVHGHTADNVAPLGVSIVVQSASHAQAADNVAPLGVFLVVQSAIHAHTAANTIITPGLLVSDGFHLHTASHVSPTLDLVVQAAAHAVSSGSPTLVETFSLTVANAVHAHSAATITLTQVHVLVVASGVHAHTADNLPTFTGGSTVVVAAGIHVHSATNIELEQDHFLAIDSAEHAHIADGDLILTYVAFLLVESALHVHTASNVDMRGIVVLNNALAVYLGNTAVTKVYAGSVQVWP